MKRLRWLGLVAALAALAWGFGAYRDTNPRFSTQTVVTPDFTISIPSHWPPPSVENPWRADSWLSIKNAPIAGSIDEHLWSMTVRSNGSATLEQVAAKLQEGSSKASPQKNILLTNGVRALTWSQWQPLGELSAENRIYVFKAADERVYSAMHWVSPHWKVAKRYENIFRGILGTLTTSARKN
jgi:hypothetical protein